jgi:hypothetical protein
MFCLHSLSYLFAVVRTITVVGFDNRSISPNSLSRIAIKEVRAFAKS